ncbi:MAG: BlaI/MecI/CopY family transcriptional regulator [Deltaproteobacteria bacterium]|nr:BlaI/MecI/CopY family transcriptional regulator [Deltaproteobacteria bacterium]
MTNGTKTRDGHQGVIGRLEQEILEVLWSRPEASGKEVHEAISANRAIALTTVLTVLERLTKKGFVTKVMGANVYAYRSAQTRDGFTRLVSHGVIKGILEISASGACASFVDTLADVNPVELERLLALIEKKKKEMGTRAAAR